MAAATSAATADALRRLFPNPDDVRLLLAPVPSLLLWGFPGVGKTSVIRTLFDGESPYDTSYYRETLNPTIRRIHNVQFAPFNVLEVPLSFLVAPADGGAAPAEALLASAACAVFVADATREPLAADLAPAAAVLARARRAGTRCAAFLHRVDGELFAAGACTDGEELRAHWQADFAARLAAALDAPNLDTYATSVYDHTAARAISAVLAPALPCAHELRDFLDAFVNNCRLENAYLMDCVSKTFVAASSEFAGAPANFALGAEAIDALADFAEIYGGGGQTRHADTITAGKLQPDGGPLAQDALQCTLQLTNGTVLQVCVLNRPLALACVGPEATLDRKFILDHNIRLVHTFVRDVFELYNL